MVRNVYEIDNTAKLKLRLICEWKSDGRVYNFPTVNEIIGLIVGDVDLGDHQDTIVYGSDGQL